MPAKTIYVVTEGDYSDRSNMAAFTTKELAEKAVELGLGDSCYSLCLLDKEPSKPPKNKRMWHICDGSYGYPISSYVIDESSVSLQTEEVSKMEGEISVVRCWAKDEDEAIAIAKKRLKDVK